MIAPDQTGLVAHFSTLLFNLGTNIDDANNHRENGTFFQRYVVTIDEVKRIELEAAFYPASKERNARFELLDTSEPERVAIFAGKTDHCLYELLLEHKQGRLPADIRMIISNHADLWEVANHFDIPFVHTPKSNGNTIGMEQVQLDLLAHTGVRLILLARYMQILSPEFVARYPERIINVHHASLPAFPGKDPYQQAHDHGVRMIGATAHFVTADLDQGPIIAQASCPCDHSDTVASLRAKGRENERKALVQAARAALEGRLFVKGRRVIQL